jgi:hypothetical protein
VVRRQIACLWHRAQLVDVWQVAVGGDILKDVALSLLLRERLDAQPGKTHVGIRLRLPKADKCG